MTGEDPAEYAPSWFLNMETENYPWKGSKGHPPTKTLNETLVLFFLPFWFWAVEFHLENVNSCFEGGKIPKGRNRSTISLFKQGAMTRKFPQNYLALMGHILWPLQGGLLTGISRNITRISRVVDVVTSVAHLYGHSKEL